MIFFFFKEDSKNKQKLAHSSTGNTINSNHNQAKETETKIDN